MFTKHNKRSRGGFIVGALAALFFALPCGLFAQSPLTVQPSTGKVGIGNTNPSETLDVTGTVKATAFKGDGSQLTNLPIGGGAEANVQVFTAPGTNVWYKPANAKQVFAYLIGGGGGGASGDRLNHLVLQVIHGGGGAWSFASWPAALLSATENVTVGDKGVGGVPVTLDNTSGNPGTAGGNTTFGNWLGGGGGAGGIAASASAGGIGMFSGGGGGSSFDVLDIGSDNPIEVPGTNGGSTPGAGGGGAGSAVYGSPYAATNGGTGSVFRGTPLTGGVRGTSGSAPTDGSDGASATPNEVSGGGGGGGGGSEALGRGGHGGGKWRTLRWRWRWWRCHPQRVSFRQGRRWDEWNRHHRDAFLEAGRGGFNFSIRLR